MGARSTRGLPNFVRGNRALYLVKYAMAALILQGAGDLAVLLNPGPESLPKDGPHCSKVIHANGALFESYMTRCLCSRPDEINISDISISDSDNCCKIQGNFKSVLNCNGMKFAPQNIRSLLSKIDELRILFADLNNILFLTLSETWHDSPCRFRHIYNLF